MIKGSTQAKEAGRKAAETRKRNKANKTNNYSKGQKKAWITRRKNQTNGISKGLKTLTYNIKSINTEKYQKILIDSPVTLHINKKMKAIYITPAITKLTSK